MAAMGPGIPRGAPEMAHILIRVFKAFQALADRFMLPSPTYAGFRLEIHAIGDACAEQVVNAFSG